MLLWTALLGAVLLIARPSLTRKVAPLVASLLLGATTLLGRALWRLDLSFTYVADHARSGVSAPYRLSGLWGGADGSLLMFTAMLAVVVAAVPWVSGGDVAARWGSGTVAVLVATVLWFADPFERLQIPAIAGGGLQPILEHPAMLYHPPILYVGLVVAFVPWAIAVGAPTANDAWRQRARVWLAVVLVLVTVGQLTGANWAYVELGWGGFWGWDPVENGILVTWLLTVAALHVVREPVPARVVATLAAAPWLSVLVGIAVTRAGVGGSVHAFADDGRTSWALLVVIVFTISVTVRQVRRLPAGRFRLRLAPIGSAAAVFGALVVLEGVLYPIPAPGEPLVAGHFYATILGPLAVVALAVCSLALARPRPVLLIGGMAVAIVLSTLAGARTPFAIAASGGVGAVVTALVGGLGDNRSSTKSTRWPVRLAHLGFAILLVGVAGSTQADHLTVTLTEGAEAQLAGVTFRHRSVSVGPGPVRGSDAVVATLDAVEGRRTVTLRPALVAFADRGVVLAETALDSRPRRDVQVVLRTATDDGAARYDLSVTPLVQPVWWGAGMVALAGCTLVVGQLWSRRRFSRARSSKADIVADSAAEAAAESA